MFIYVQNDDCNPKLVAETNYWDSILFENGSLFFSVNAGCVRMFLPRLEAWNIDEILDDSVYETTKYIIISRGIYQRRDCYEILFEDGTENPYAIFTSADAWDRSISSNDTGASLEFHIYEKRQLIRRYECRFRFVSTLPCLKPWHPNWFSQNLKK